MNKSLLFLTLALGLSSCNLLDAGKPAVQDVVVLGLNDFHGNLEATGFAGIKIPDPKDATKTINLPAGAPRSSAATSTASAAPTPTRSSWAAAT